MQRFKTWCKKHGIQIAIVVLIILGISIAVIDHRAYLHQPHFLNSYATWKSTRHHGPLTATNVGMIKPWMTFDYINKIFALSPDFLKTNLSISDSHYPLITLSSYAKNQHLDAVTFTTTVENTVSNYFLSTK